MKIGIIALILFFVGITYSQQIHSFDHNNKKSKNSRRNILKPNLLNAMQYNCPPCSNTNLTIEVIPEGTPGIVISKKPGEKITMAYSHEGCYDPNDQIFEHVHFNILTHPSLVKVTDPTTVYHLYDENINIGQDPHWLEYGQARDYQTTCWGAPANGNDEFTIPCDIEPGDYKLKIDLIMEGCGGTFIYCQTDFSANVTSMNDDEIVLTGVDHPELGNEAIDCEMTNLRVVTIIGNNIPTFVEPTPPSGTTLEVRADETLTLDIVASDADVTNMLTLTNTHKPSGATITSIPQGNPVSTAFSWTPTLSQVGMHYVSFRVEDDVNCPSPKYNFSTINIRVVPPLGKVCIKKYFDENHNQSREISEEVMADVDFNIVKNEDPFTTYSGTTDNTGKVCFEGLEPGTYTITEILPEGYAYSAPATGQNIITIPGDEGEIIWLNQSAKNNTFYRTATYMEWANGGVNPRAGKSARCIANSVKFKFTLQAPFAVKRVTINFNMNTSGTLTKGTSKLEVLTTWTNQRSVSYSGILLSGETVQFEGTGNSGRTILANYQWTHNILRELRRGSVSSYILNETVLPMPNLHNVGEQLFAQNAFPDGLKIGTKELTNGAHSVHHKKYSDVYKSLYDIHLLHTGTPRCLSTYNNGKPILKQVKHLSPVKHSNALFGELLALKLNIAASDRGKFPVGLKELIYDNHALSPGPFDGKYIWEIVNQADIFMTCVGDPKNTTAEEYYTVIKNINEAFNGPIDIISWDCSKVLMTGVLALKDVPYLRAEPGVIPPFLELSSDVVAEEFPSTFNLQNYPNPFNPTTMISFNLPDDALVTLKVYDVIGREIAVLANNILYEAGNHELEFDASSLGNGIYFYRLSAQGETMNLVDVKKMVLMK